MVADEVGKLASETAAQTAQIRETINRTRSQMEDVVSAAAAARERSATSTADADTGLDALERITALIGIFQRSRDADRRARPRAAL